MAGQDFKGQVMSRLVGAPVTKWLLLINLAIFVLGFDWTNSGDVSMLTYYGCYVIPWAFEGGQVWRLLSFQFLHGDLGHLFFNMFGLYMFGGMCERILGSRRYVAYYLLCGMAGALFYTLLVLLGWLSSGVLVGASAGIFGILVAMAMRAPDMRVQLLFPPIPMQLRTFALAILGLGVFVVLSSGPNAGGEAGHLGGALMGYLFMRYPRTLDWTELKRGRKKSGKVRKAYEPKLRPRSSVNLDSSEVDRILDKVNKGGMQSLTEEERQTLLRVSRGE
ncbi:rhomboid family intramembrane serine protease [Rubritalea tangerina]|uniref:Rhomboid family intramembrane serine protease n=1 Tax=Rubritalea tangerina TaxID=430798 RepID=A0ABW4ZAI6_9BACT